MTTYAIQDRPQPAVVFATNSKHAAFRYMREMAPSCALFGVQNDNVIGRAIYFDGHLRQVSYESAVAGMHLDWLGSDRRFVELPLLRLPYSPATVEALRVRDARKDRKRKNRK